MDDVGEQLAGWGKVVTLETRGRISGKTSVAAVGYVEEPDGSLLVAAGSEDADWARNLLADQNVLVRLADDSWTATAEPLAGADAARAVRELILRYGTPAERLGRGPAFRITRTVRRTDGGGPGQATAG